MRVRDREKTRKQEKGENEIERDNGAADSLGTVGTGNGSLTCLVTCSLGLFVVLVILSPVCCCGSAGLCVCVPACPPARLLVRRSFRRCIRPSVCPRVHLSEGSKCHSCGNQSLLCLTGQSQPTLRAANISRGRNQRSIHADKLIHNLSPNEFCLNFEN